MSTALIKKEVPSARGGLEMFKRLHIAPIEKKIYDATTRSHRTAKTFPPVSFFINEQGGDLFYAPRAIAREYKMGPYSDDEDVRRRHLAIIPPHARIPDENAQFTSTLRPAQQEAMRQASEALEKETGCIFRMRPGFGKTVCAAYQITRLKLRALVLVNRVNLIDQWVGTFKNMTTLRAAFWDASVKNSAKLSRAMDWDNIDVLISSNTCMKHIPRGFLQTVGVLVVDEAHMFCTPGSVRTLLDTTPSYAIACTATPEREDGMHEMLYQVFGKIEITATNDVPYKLYRVFSPFRPSTGDGANINWSAVTQSLAACEERNRAIVRLAAHLAQIPLLSQSGSAAPGASSREKRKVLILTRLAEHVEILEQMLNDEGINAVSTLYRNKRSYRDAPILIGTMSKISVGFDEANACEDDIEQRIDSLILATSMKDKASIEQTFGRAFRSKEPEIYFFVDLLSSIERHWKSAVAYAKKSLGTVHSFDLTPFLDPE